MELETLQHSAPPSPTSSQAGISRGGNGTAAKVLRRACDCCRKRKVKCDGAEPCGPCKKATIRCAYLQPPKKKGPKGLRSARVLHALRTIDDTASGDSTAPVSPREHQGAFGNWGWSSATSTPVVMQTAYGPPTSLPPEQQTYPQAMQPAPPADMRSYAPTHPPVLPPLYRSDTQQSGWSLQQDHSPPQSAMLPPILSERPPQRIPGDRFLPYMQLFFGHMFPIMPVLDRNLYLDPRLYAEIDRLDSDMYCLLCALCAAIIVQLDATVPLPFPDSKPMDEVFAEECLRERKSYDFIAPTSTLSCLTSFFLFAYYGNHESLTKAWFYLQEAVTFAQNLNMDDEQAYDKFDPVEAQWRRRLYWLLFVTERAYAMQRRKHTRLHPSIDLPVVFDSEDPGLLNGFVNLAKLFSVVDDNFVSAWRGIRRQSLCDEAWLANTQRQLDAAASALENISETQHVDINVTRQWLHVLAWQIGVSNGLIWGKEETGTGMRLEYPIELARRVVQITEGSSKAALESHGIGMEQKLSDIAGCLADVLRCTEGDMSATFIEGRQCLNILLQKLSSIRGKESRYLKPLMTKTEGLIGYELNGQPALAPMPAPLHTQPARFPPTVAVPHGGGNNYLAPLPGNGRDGQRTMSMADSVGMLRSLSMSGNLGMPFLAVSGENWEWQPRRPSGRPYEELDTRMLGAGSGHGWAMAQPV
ncbi:hypothetical protein LTR17_006322 [Elasticomyces elasticus]|nr:hypothetical protein LTR17_006322 [Elasticomyces elasticus]